MCGQLLLTPLLATSLSLINLNPSISSLCFSSMTFLVTSLLAVVNILILTPCREFRLMNY